MRWVFNEAKKSNIENLLFVARDGYSLEKVFNTFNENINTSYIYAPRFLNLIYRIDYNKRDIKQSSAIINYYKDKDLEIKKLTENAILKTAQQCHEFIQANADIFIKIAEKEWGSYKDYIKTNLSKQRKNIGIIDSITGEFSSQRLLESALESSVVGYYWGILNIKSKQAFKTKQFAKNKIDSSMEKQFTKNWNFMELLMTAPEYPIKRILANGSPVYDENPSEAEKIRKTIYPDIANGVMSFAEDVKKIFGKRDIWCDAKTLISWVDCLCDFPEKEDLDNMSIIRHSADSAHKDYDPLFSVKLSWGDVLKHPFNSIRVVKKALWTTPLQKFALCFAAPIKVKKKGLKRFEILLFYKLSNNIFNITLFNRYGLNIGKKNET